MKTIIFIDNDINECQKLESFFMKEMRKINKTHCFNKIHLFKAPTDTNEYFRKKISERVLEIINKLKKNIVFLIDMEMLDSNSGNGSDEYISLLAMDDVINTITAEKLKKNNIQIIFITNKTDNLSKLTKSELYIKNEKFYKNIRKPGSNYRFKNCPQAGECDAHTKGKTDDLCKKICLEEMLLKYERGEKNDKQSFYNRT